MNDLRDTFAPDLVQAIEQLVDLRVKAALENVSSDGSPWFTVVQSAAYLQTSPRSIQRLLKRGCLRSAYIGSTRLLHRDDLDAYMRATTGEDVAPTTPPRRRRPSLERVSPEA